MKKFKFRLATLVKLREAARTDRRLQLAEAFRVDEVLQEQLGQAEAMISEYRQEQRAGTGPGTIDVDQLLAQQRYLMLLEIQRRSLMQQRQNVAQEIERRRQALVEADREVRVLENLEQRQRARWNEERSRQELQILDEVAQRRSAAKEGP